MRDYAVVVLTDTIILYLVFRGSQEITPSTSLSVLADYYLASKGRQARPQRNPSSQVGGAVSSTR